MLKLLRKFTFLSIFFLQACSGDNVPDGQIMVKNDSRDREYNVITVSGGGRSYTLSPREHAILPKGTRTIRLSRRYSDHTREYVVECPGDLGKGISIKMIDVHVNRIAGGCQTISGDKH